MLAKSRENVYTCVYSPVDSIGRETPGFYRALSFLGLFLIFIVHCGEACVFVGWRVYLVGMTRTNGFAVDRRMGAWLGVRGVVMVVMIVMMGAAGLCGGCATRADVTGGYAYVLRVSDAKRQLVYYELKDDGTLNFVGGVRAGLEMEGLASPTWSGKFTRAELDGVIALIAGAGGEGAGGQEIKEVEPRSEETNFKLSLRVPGRGERRYVSGPTEFFVELARRSRGLMISKRPELGDPTIRPVVRE